MSDIFSRRAMTGGLLPFVPALIGIALKFTFIDKFDAQTHSVSTFLFDTYLRSAWIDFIVLAYVSGYAAMASNSQKPTATSLWIYLGLPAVCFLICILLVIATRKAGLESDFLQVYVPTLITGFSLATTGARNVQESR